MPRPLRTALITPLFAVLIAMVSACGSDIPLPAAAPLQIDNVALNSLYGAVAGPFSVSRAIQHLPATAKDQRELEVSLYYPQSGSAHPLLLFSHGNWSDRHSYDQIIEHWVSHGYVVIAADHADCCSPVQGIFNSLRYGQFGLIQQRVLDLRQLLDQLQLLEKLSKIQYFHLG